MGLDSEEKPQVADIVSRSKSLQIIAAIAGIGLSCGLLIGSIKEQLNQIDKRFESFDSRIETVESQFSSQSEKLRHYGMRLGVVEKLEERSHSHGR